MINKIEAHSSIVSYFSKLNSLGLLAYLRNSSSVNSISTT
nr:MAG TPA: hypothetical protein [Caudoviricetes sp.]